MTITLLTLFGIPVAILIGLGLSPPWPRPHHPGWWRLMDNFAWWHRLRRHRVERSGYSHHGWATGLLALALHCRTCNREWDWTIH